MFSEKKIAENRRTVVGVRTETHTHTHTHTCPHPLGVVIEKKIREGERERRGKSN